MTQTPAAPPAAAPPPGVAPRVVAARVLSAVIDRGRSLKAELATALPTLPDPRDRALVEAICFAALRRRPAYEAALRLWLQKQLPQRDAELRTLLMAGFAQLDVLGLAPHAALSATVEAARALDRPRQAGMVNALLRRALRDGLPEVAADAGWPLWLRDALHADWPQQAEAIFAASQQAAPLWLRVNRQRGTRDAYLQQLAEAGIGAQAVPDLADAIRLGESVAMSALPGFADGWVSVQDGSAQQVADVLAPAPGARVLDACAAPGGKSAHLLERDPRLRLTALDVDARRLARVRETFQRTGAGAQAQLQVADAAQPDSWWDGEAFDAVLLDAPCSATGIVRRQPDVLLHRRREDVVALQALQARLLDAGWQVLRPGGVLVYATCSLLKDENARQLQAFLARTADAVAEDPGAACGHADGGGRQRLPGEQDRDGFFYARLRKTA
ncbi:16S rRNA (cytosine(967)-C(5))-methyltransferase RsmB [Xanthomonas translucens pv. undulosa]|uniref:16S rRNA (cytosine(967)-C(5))-methyltransferase RsmB n=4 Tax=Xanthomonas campestris pv. translucens TaxID=343 RepID=UPI00071E7072|nr:16S rRNA (cytosine(967)-C(5))-methyltransferase RsmB [Xanthomonas translucens]QEO25222.1 16S rRNA (cytosine(967)-C(5))-methyltransferase RsmB [Xanthomonas translucens pv. undulosa]QSQ41656.1 16S rRNA (cytosine(967)-C(5))-methyltransferase RsmB [Xanthomonas translucens pv. translucens]QSQ50471.1 16S rRNA (cytosine(967)-C(5))-methyltransferase RsmB [Xanthomonas translucens pv. undulosa]QSQ52859.1 16S rRNA (cytosine(967)-C(5))-methyltransferase RsmB [Xanthomonas translucens pv. undulosa]QSQ615